MTFRPDSPDATEPTAPAAPQPAPESAPQPAWARPVAQQEWRETEPLEYQKLLRGTPRFRWWKPLLGLFLGASYYFAFSIGYTLIVAAVAAVVLRDSFDVNQLAEMLTPDTQQPLSMLLALGSISLMIPAALLAMLSVGLSPAGRLWSVALRIRWRWIGRTIVPALLALLLVQVCGMLLDAVTGAFADSGTTAAAGGSDAAADAASFSVTAALWSVLFILLLVPLQATAEELIFRGAFMQALGSWKNKVWFVVLLAAGLPLGGLILYLSAGVDGLVETGGRVLIVTAVVFAAAALMKRFTGSPFIVVAVPSVIFALAHIYEIWGMLSVASMAVVAAWLVWRTGGLEAAITLHVVNNVVAFMFMVFAYGGETGQTAEGGSPTGLLLAVLSQVAYAWWVDRDFGRTDGRRTRIDRVVQRSLPVPAAQPIGGAAA